MNFSQLLLTEMTYFYGIANHLTELFLNHQANNLIWENLALLCKLNTSGLIAVLKYML